MVSVKGRKIRKAVVVKKPSVSLANRILKKKKTKILKNTKKKSQ